MKYYIIASIIVLLLSGGVAWWFLNKCGADEELVNGECVKKCLNEQVRDSDGKCNWIPCEQVDGAGEGWSRNVDNVCIAPDTPIPDEPVEVKLDDLNFRKYGPVGDGCNIESQYCSSSLAVDDNLLLEPRVINSRHVIFTDSQENNNGNYADFSSKTIVFDAGEYDGNPRSWEFTVKKFDIEECCDRLGLEVSNDGIMWTNAQIPQLTTVNKYDERKYKWYSKKEGTNKIVEDDTPGYIFSNNVVKDTPFQTNNRFLRFSFFSDHSVNQLGWEILLKAHPILATN